MKVLLLQLFWLSFAVIGFAEFRLVARFSRAKKPAALAFLSETHSLIAILVAFAAGLSTFALVVVPGCLLQWPIVVVKVSYLVLLVGSIGVLIRERASILRGFARLRLTKKGYFLLLVVGGVLALDYWTSMRTGGQLAGDAQFELAQITLFAQKHLTLADPIFGKNGVPPTVYSTSIQHAVQALAANLFNTSAAWVWFYSHAFFRLLLWLSFFGLAWEFLDKKVRANWSYAILLLLPLVYGNSFAYPELHNQIVYAWTALFIVGVKVWLDRKSTFLLFISATLIASAHPLNAFMAASYLGLLAAILVVTRLTRLKEAVRLMPILAILLLPMVLYLYYPHGITSAGFKDAPSFGETALRLRSYGPIFVNVQYPGFGMAEILMYALLPIYVLIARRFSDKRLNIGITLLAICGVLVAYTSQLISFIGYLYLIVKSKTGRVRIAVILLVIYTGIITYNPVLLSLAHGWLPLWTLSRFQDLNMFAFVAPTIGLLCIFVLPFRSLGYKRLPSALIIAAVAVSVLVVPILAYSNGAINNVFAPRRDLQRQHRATLDTLDTLRGFGTQLRGQVVFSDDPGLPAIIPGAVATNVFSIDNEANASPSVHITQRKACAQQLRLHLRASDLRASGITEIITSPYSTASFRRLLRVRPDVHLQKQQDGYGAYSVSESNQPNRTGICAISPTL